MATMRNLRERTVAFYEIVRSTPAEQKRIPHSDWESVLASIARASLEERKVEKEALLVGSVATINEQDHLLLHRAKDSSEWLSVMDWGTGEWYELEQSASRGYLETSAICFLPFGNVVGMMHGSASAPTHKSLETWLNSLHLFPGKDLAVRPVLTKAEVERLQTARGVSRVEVKIGSHKMATLRGKTGRLANFLRSANETYGDIDVTMIISVPKGKALMKHREMLLEDLREIAEVAPEATERARAKLVYADAEGPEYTRLVEITEHHITAKRRVSAVDEDGNSIRILSAVDAILGVAAEHEDELRAAVEAVED